MPAMRNLNPIEVLQATADQLSNLASALFTSISTTEFSMTESANEETLNTATQKVYTASEMFTIEVDQRSNATFDPLNLIYAFILNGPDYVEMYNVFSYSSLVYALNKVGSNSLINGTSNPVLQHLKPLVANPKYKFTNDTSGFVSRVAYCKFPFQCILSHATDPLLIRIQELYYVLWNIYDTARPGNFKYMVSSLDYFKNYGDLTIPKPECYKYAKCYGITQHNETAKYHSKMMSSALEKMLYKDKNEILTYHIDFLSKVYCGNLQWLCNADGDCKPLTEINLSDEILRSKIYLESIVKPFAGMDKMLNLTFERWQLHLGQDCTITRCYSSTSGLFDCQPEESKQWLPLLNMCHNFFAEFTRVFFQPLLDVKESELCFEGKCLEIKFKNNLANNAVQEPLNPTLANIMLYTKPSPVIFSPRNNTAAYFERNKRVARDISSDNSQATLDQAKQLENEKNNKQNEVNVQNTRRIIFKPWGFLFYVSLVAGIVGSVVFAVRKMNSATYHAGNQL